MQFFSKVSLDIIDCNVEKGQQEKMCCPVGFLEELITVFLSDSVSNWHRKWQKPQNFSIFKVFTHFLLKFWQSSWFEMF